MAAWLALALLVGLHACAADGETDSRGDSRPGTAGNAVLGAAGSGGVAAGSFAPPAGGPAPAGTSATGAPSGPPLTTGGVGSPATGGRGIPFPTGGSSAAAGSGMAGRVGVAGSAGGPVGGIAGGGAGAGGAAAGSSADGETGRQVGMTAAHNKVRAMVQSATPLPPMTWSPTLAAYAQEWADSLAKNSCDLPMHRSGQQLQQKGYGENLAAAGGTRPPNTTAQWAVDGWAGEVACYTFGTINVTEKCDMTCYKSMQSDGCGHYTQIVWRKSTQVGCGVATCMTGGLTTDIWICNYAPPGNVVGQNPY